MSKDLNNDIRDIILSKNISRLETYLKNNILEEEILEEILIEASDNRLLNFVEVLVQHGANLNKVGNQLIYEASANNFPEMVEYYIKKGIDIHNNEDYLLQYNSYEGNLEITKMLYYEGANIHIKDDLPIRWAAENDKTDILLFFLKEKVKFSDNTMIVIYSSLNSFFKVKNLVENKQINQQRIVESVEIAIRKNYSKIVDLLINSFPFSLEEKKKFLHSAAWYNHLDIVKILLNLDIEIKQDLEEYMEISKRHNNEEMYNLFLNIL